MAVHLVQCGRGVVVGVAVCLVRGDSVVVGVAVCLVRGDSVVVGVAVCLVGGDKGVVLGVTICLVGLTGVYTKFLRSLTFPFSRMSVGA